MSTDTPVRLRTPGSRICALGPAQKGGPSETSEPVIGRSVGAGTTLVIGGIGQQGSAVAPQILRAGTAVPLVSLEARA